jgi:hypothetical protein
LVSRSSPCNQRGVRQTAASAAVMRRRRQATWQPAEWSVRFQGGAAG